MAWGGTRSDIWPGRDKVRYMAREGPGQIYGQGGTRSDIWPGRDKVRYMAGEGLGQILYGH